MRCCDYHDRYIEANWLSLSAGGGKLLRPGDIKGGLNRYFFFSVAGHVLLLTTRRFRLCCRYPSLFAKDAGDDDSPKFVELRPSRDSSFNTLTQILNPIPRYGLMSRDPTVFSPLLYMPWDHRRNRKRESKSTSDRAKSKRKTSNAPSTSTTEEKQSYPFNTEG